MRIGGKRRTSVGSHVTGPAPHQARGPPAAGGSVPRVNIRAMPLKDPEARKAYHRAYMRRRYNQDESFRERHKAHVRVNTKRYVAEAKELVAGWKAQGCIICGESEACCLDAHHREPDFTIGEAIRRKLSPRRVKAELRKCACLCANCHRKLHKGLVALPV